MSFGSCGCEAALVLIILLVQLVPFLARLIPLFLMLNKVNLTNTLTGGRET